MHRSTSERPTTRAFSIVLALALVAGMLVVLAQAVGAVVNTCWAKNLTKGTASRSNLQRVISAANAGDRIAVRYVCVGNFTIAKKLTLVGQATTRVPKPVLHANGSGRVLRVSARVLLTNLKITGGDVSALIGGGGIYNDGGILTMSNTVVRDNRAEAGAGITNDGVLIMNGSSSVASNSGQGGEGAGIFNASGNSILTMNHSSSVGRNTSGGIYNYYGTVRMNGSSSVRENTGSGVINYAGFVTLNGSSSVSGNTTSASGSPVGAGIRTDFYGILTLNDSSSVSGNSADFDGGGIYATGNSSVILNESSSVTGNTADADDATGGTGGGIYHDCTSSLTGAVDGGNVNDNYRGTATPVEDNIDEQSPCP